jgi:hypothetical protein
MVLQEFFKELGVSAITYCIDGQKAIDTCRELIDDEV